MIKVNKNYISNLVYYVAFRTRFNRTIFDNDKNINLFQDSIKEYLEEKEISILKYQYQNDTVILKIMSPPIFAPTNVVFNIKRISSPILVKNNREILQGEHAIWTRSYVVSNSYDELIKLMKLKDE